MRTSTSIGKRAGVLGGIVCTLLCCAGAVPRVTDFEGYELGQFPGNVFSVWGGWGQKGALAYVTNIRAAGGEKSFVVNMAPKAPGGGLVWQLADGTVSNGTMTIAFDYLREKYGNVSFEFRGSYRLKNWPKHDYLRFGADAVALDEQNRPTKLGPIQSYHWYHVKLVCALSPDVTPAATLEMRDRTTGEVMKHTWKTPFLRDARRVAKVSINTSGSVSAQMMYFDNLEVCCQVPE